MMEWRDLIIYSNHLKIYTNRDRDKSVLCRIILEELNINLANEWKYS